MFQFLAKEVFKVIVFHGSPRYFGKFNNDKIGAARSYNPVQGHYFTYDIALALSYTKKFISLIDCNPAFIEHQPQNATGYLYVCEVPDKSELLDCFKSINNLNVDEKAIIENILADEYFRKFYFEQRTNDTIGELIRLYFIHCNVIGTKLADNNIYTKYKGLIHNYFLFSNIKIPEIIIFNSNNICLKQCFRIDIIPPETTETAQGDKIYVLFKRFGEYYTALGRFETAKTVRFDVKEQNSKIVPSIISLKDMEQNPYILAYYISKPAQSQVTEANISSLNYNPRNNTRPEKANIFTTEYIKKYCDIDNYQPVRSKILNLTEFAEYKRQTDNYKYMGSSNPFIQNITKDIIYNNKVNALFLQREETPYFNIRHQDPKRSYTRL